MTFSGNHAIFSLDDIHQAASGILAARPDPVVAHRLLREVLRLPPGDRELCQAEKAAQGSHWIRRLAEAQLADGSWGRFHSQDTRVKGVVRTTEEAIDRAFSLGLQPDGSVLSSARGYILDVLHGKARLTDRVEKHESWPVVIKLIMAGRLAQIEPTDRNLDLFWVYLEDIAEFAFAAGSYHLEDEVGAHLNLSGTRMPLGFLESQHALWVLSARPMPGWLEQTLVEWIWHKPDGMRYVRASLAGFKPRHVGYWIRSMNIVTRFPSWREIALKTMNRVWLHRGVDGLWDFGSNIARIADFPLSKSWRAAGARKYDTSTCLLVLFRRYFD